MGKRLFIDYTSLHKNDRFIVKIPGFFSREVQKSLNEANRNRGSGWLRRDLKGNKIWIENDGTEVGVANLLVERGVDKKILS